jgi:formylmethanofuran dehydrogenase subunit E
MEIEQEIKDMMESAVEFHGHACPGLAIGVVASKIALDTAKPPSIIAILVRRSGSH